MDIFLENLFVFIRIINTMMIYGKITGSYFSKRWYIIVPIILRILFFIVPPIAYFSTLLFLVFYTLYYNKYNNRLLDIFYGLFPVIIESLFRRLLTGYAFPLFNIENLMITKNYFWGSFLEVLVSPVFYLLMKVLKVNFDNLQRGFQKNLFKMSLLLVDVSMIIYFTLLQILVIFESSINNAIQYRGFLTIFYTILFFVLLVYINGVVNEELEKEVVAQKDRQIQDLANYSRQIEELYNEIRSFRHDYINILSSIKTGIDHEDIGMVREVYDKVLVKSGRQVQGQRYAIANLINVKDEAIKSVLSAKVLKAQNKGIEINVEVFEEFTVTSMDILDFITILAILLDNAIEAVTPESSQCIMVALIADEYPVLVVENSIDIERIDISKIYQLGYSTKGEDRGIGLANLQQILKKYPKVSLQTKSGNYKFSQIIRIGK